MSKHPFLSHVAGMRGIAIFLVVWFHLSSCNPVLPVWASLPCGYYGVDIFLVIMGYFLISGFVKRPDYSLSQFAESKVMRIIPPMAIMIMLAFAACMWEMDFKELRTIAKTGLGAMLGYANYQLIDSSAGYFAEDSTLNAYLHTWYLAVTLQVFALGYALFALLRKCSHRTILGVLGSIAFISLLWHQAENIRSFLVWLGMPTCGPRELASYYDTLPRLWEILAGGLILYLPSLHRKWLNSTWAALGLVLMLLPAFLSPLQGINLALPVVAGTLLVIRYLPQSMLNPLINNRVLLWLGKISFSVYLVHMPLIVLYRANQLHAPGLAWSCLLMLLSMAIGYMFWFSVEKRRFSRRAVLCLWLGATALCGVADATRGLQKLWNAKSNAIDIPRYTEWEACYDETCLSGLDRTLHKDEGGWHTMAAGKNKALDTPLLWLGRPSTPADKPSFVLIGDSHAQAFFAGFDICSKEAGITGVYLSSIMIPFWDREVLPITKQYYYNRAKGESFMAWLRAQPQLRTIIIAQYWTRFSNLTLDWDRRPVVPGTESNAAALREFCKQVKSCGKEVIILGPLPDFSGSKTLSYARWLNRKGLPAEAEQPAYICHEKDFTPRFARETATLNQLQNEGLCHVLHPAAHMFNNGVCKAIDDGVIQYKDANHITCEGAASVLRKLLPDLLPLLKPEKE